MDATLPDLARVRPLVDRRFRVYDAMVNGDVLAFFVETDPSSLDGDFDALRRDLKPAGYLPLLKYQGGEHAIYVVHRPEMSFRSQRVNLVLFALTWLTTTLAGVLAWFLYTHPTATSLGPGVFLDPANWFWGFLTYALPLMLILGIHEMGHYVMTKRHGMEASLPFFIPLPPIMAVNLGTLGAFISMREPIPNRKALLDIGVAGPIAGFVVAIPVLFLGLLLMKLDPVTVANQAGVIQIQTPLIYDLLAAPFNFPQDQLMHPTAFAGWVGLFVTAINLLPAGQLDGGHMAAALLGDKAHYLSYATVVVLLILGIGIPQLGLPGFTSWLIFALLIALLGVRHPPALNDVSTLDRRRVIIGILGFALILLCFTPVPFHL